jgi:Prp8 binding protein
VCFSDQVDQVFSGGLDNQIRCWDIRAGKAKVNAKQEPEPLYAMAGHTDTVTGISLSPDGSHLLSNGLDNAARVPPPPPLPPPALIFEASSLGFLLL